MSRSQMTIIIIIIIIIISYSSTSSSSSSSSSSSIFFIIMTVITIVIISIIIISIVMSVTIIISTIFKICKLQFLVNCLPTEHLGVLRNPLKRVRAFHNELEFGYVGFLYWEGKTGVPGEKTLGTRARTNNKLNPHMQLMQRSPNHSKH